MLDFLGQPKAAAAINRECQEVAADAEFHTRDLGGTASTQHVGEAVVGRLAT